jgi:hypothetical protein
MLKADGFNEAIIGMCSDIATSGERLIYNANKCIDILIRDHEMSEEEAIEYFEFNVSGAYVGENTPIWLYPYEDL